METSVVLLVAAYAAYAAASVPVTWALFHLERAWDHHRGSVKFGERDAYTNYTRRSGYQLAGFALVWPVMILAAVIFTAVYWSVVCLKAAHRLGAKVY